MRKEKGKVIFGLTLILLDQLSKFVVVGTNLAVINKGVFFGWFEISFFGILGMLGILGILGAKNKFPYSFIMMFSGGISNIVDRIFRGGVADFIDLKIIPVFNFADIAICVGVSLFLIDFIFKRRV